MGGTLVYVRGNLLVFVLLAPYGNPGSIPGRDISRRELFRLLGTGAALFRIGD